MTSKLIEDEDFYYDPNGLMVMTAKYLRERGFCCENGCRHCPYGFTDKLQASNEDV